MRLSRNSKVLPLCKLTTELALGKWRRPEWAFSAKSCIVCSLQILLLTSLLGALAAVQLAAQTAITTWHYDDGRTSANTSEVLLAPSNVNVQTFGKLFSQPVDGIVVGHPLYLPGVNIPNQGTHNVVYVATMHDSVYAFDADNPNSGPLWMTSILAYSPPGATTVPTTVQKNSNIGWTEVGIISTPVIDPSSGTLYLVAETYENGKVVHRLHALDVTTGLETLGGPTTLAATFTLNSYTSTFTDLYQMNRPGLLLANGHVYIALGSNGSSYYSQGWVMSYNASTLQQEGAFDDDPGKSGDGIWQKGAGISADSDGNIYAETAEGPFAPGTNLPVSVFKLSQVGTTLSLADWFTPYNYQYLCNNDLDLNDGVLILPDQPGAVTHELIAVGKEGTVYVLNRDYMGQLCSTCTTTDTQIVQELYKAVGPETGTPVYWNNNVYFTGQGSPVMAFTLNNGSLAVPPSAQSAKMGGGGHAVITSDGTSNGILWFNKPLTAMDASTMKVLYTSSQAANGRDTLPPVAHFANPVVADGKVFIGTQNSLVIYGLFPALSVVGGSGQSASVASPLPIPLSVQAMDPYTGQVFPGVTVTFSDGGKGGSFNPSTVTTDQNGSASSVYTLPTKAGSYALTASASGYASGAFTATALPGAATTLLSFKGSGQTVPVNTSLPIPLVTKASDSSGNGIPGVAVSYSDSGAGGVFSANPVNTDSRGLATVNYTTPTAVGTVKITGNVTGLSPARFHEAVTSGPVANIVTTSGDGQSAPPSTQLAQALVVKVTDQYGNAVSGASVSFADGGAGGTFASNPVLTTSTGLASDNYITPPNTGTVTVQATVSGVSAAANFTVTVQ
ncbi:MAG: hypothetical protein WCF26_08610 [Candidatus Sulfotelmatobacter sp.]